MYIPVQNKGELELELRRNYNLERIRAVKNNQSYRRGKKKMKRIRAEEE